jgi:hypothetical protein
MGALALERIVVWLDELAPERGAFAHALEWAERLRLPLKAFAATAGGDGLSAQLDACERECLRLGVSWEVFRWQGPLDFGAKRFLRPTELSVFGSGLAPAVRQALLERALQSPPSPVLVCPSAWRPVTRVLVLNDQGEAESCFLDLVAHVCLAFQAAPVILTVGWSEREAQRRQRQAEERLAVHRLPADFDCLVGCDGPGAVGVVARWRRCSHVFVERPPRAPWWRSWLRSGAFEQLPRLDQALTVLALPGAACVPAAATAEKVQPARSLRWAWGLG